MIRLPLLLAGILGAHYLWPYFQDDERLIWVLLLPVVYIVGMWALAGNDG